MKLANDIKWALIALGGIAILFWLVCVEPNRRSQEAWDTCRRDFEAKGVTFDWNAYVPPPVPDDKNFFKAPKMQQWFQVNSDPYDDKHNELWGLSTNHNTIESITNSGQAKIYLAWNDQFRPQFDLVRAALKRPYARMKGAYFVPNFIPMPSLVPFRYVSLNLALRAKCDLILGRPTDALDELTFLDQFRSILDLQPSGKPMSLVTALINASIAGFYYVPVIAEGLKTHAWDRQQLELLQKQLQSIHLPPLLINAIRLENAHACYWIQTNLMIETKSPYARRVLLQSLVDITELDQQAAEAFNPSNGIFPADLDAWDRKRRLISASPDWQGNNMTGINIFDLDRTWRIIAARQTLINEAQIACALERYRLAHGEYPETLDELSPQFIEIIPHDLIGARPLYYHRTGNGNFLLYSVGWNEKDDAGQPSPRYKNGTVEYNSGDWVWPNH